jgi:hypothetical protein
VESAKPGGELPHHGLIMRLFREMHNADLRQSFTGGQSRKWCSSGNERIGVGVAQSADIFTRHQPGEG